MPSHQSSQTGRRYKHFTFCIGILIGSLLIAAWMPAGRAQPANAYSKETFTYKKVGNLEIKADVYRPAGTGPHPAIVWIHGVNRCLSMKASVSNTVRYAARRGHTDAGFAGAAAESISRVLCDAGPRPLPWFLWSQHPGSRSIPECWRPPMFPKFCASIPHYGYQ
jgi:hypothetical protein